MRNNLCDVRFDDFVVLFEDVCVNQFVFLGGLKMHAVVIAELLLNVLKVLI